MSIRSDQSLHLLHWVYSATFAFILVATNSPSSDGTTCIPLARASEFCDTADAKGPLNTSNTGIGIEVADLTVSDVFFIEGVLPRFSSLKEVS